MILIKPGVKFHPDTFRYPEMSHIIYEAHILAPSGYELTITSACDGKHKENSKHYKGKAIDFRIRDFPESVEVWARRLQNRLGDEYFILLESTHLHCQFNGG